MLSAAPVGPNEIYLYQSGIIPYSAQTRYPASRTLCGFMFAISVGFIVDMAAYCE